MRTADPDRMSLASALAQATPAFTRKPIPASPQMSTSDRLILALAELTPAFVPDFDNPAPRDADGRPWYRHPVSLILALGVVLGIPAAVLTMLPDGPGPTAVITQTTTRATTSAPVTSSTTSTPVISSTTSTPVTTVITPTAPPPSTTTVTATETTTVTTTIPTPTVTSTVPTTVTTTVTTTVAGPPLVQTNCLDGSTVTSPQACPPPPHPNVH